MQQRDIFVCHASEDKEEIVRPMIESFQQAGITCWYDEAEINWGDSITERVNEGLRISRYVLVVFSRAFTEKQWPQRELNAVLNAEASTGEVKVLPLLVGSNHDVREVLAKYPLLNDKRYLPWDGDLRKIVEALLSRLHGPGEQSERLTPQQSRKNIGLKVPLPKIKKKLTQRDKDLFLREAFGTVKTYFKNALAELENQYQEVKTDFMEIHNFKFVATIYVRGEIGSRCKIWLGGPTSSNSIAYQRGEFSNESDNSFNDILSVADNEETLGFTGSLWSGAYRDSPNQVLNAEQAAEHLWRRFTENLA
jgi:hypothetical protein